MGQMAFIQNITDKDFVNIRFPILCTPKTQGLRCITDWRGVPMTGIGREVVNDHVRNKIIEYGLDGVDGEIVIVGEGSHAQTVAQLQKKEGRPEFEFVVNDLFINDMYVNRINNLDSLITKPRPDFIKLKSPATVYDGAGLVEYWRVCAEGGSHGIYAKKQGMKYNPEPSTVMWGYWLSYEKWDTGWATITEFKDDGNNLLKSVICKDKESGVSFKVEHGFDASQRKELWKNRAQYTGFTVSYEYQPTGSKIPTTPICKKVSRR